MSEWKTIDKEENNNDLILIPLTFGLFARIDISDYDLVSSYIWQAQYRSDMMGFYAINSNGIRMHRMILKPEDGYIVDHIDGNGLNNTRGNIRIGTQSQNCVNRKRTPGPYMRGTRPKGNRWQSYIKFNGVQRSLGYYDNEQDAHNVYLKEAIKLHGDWMPLPQPPES